MTPVETAVAAARKRLEAAGVPGAARDAMVLLDATDIGGAATLSAAQVSAYDAAVARRIAREPVSHILGRRSFWMHDFQISADVLDPRPETERLVEAALAARGEVLKDPERWPNEPTLDWPPVPFRRVLDLGTGSGCILMSLLHEVPDATGVGTDVSPAALAIAEQNATLVGVADRVVLRQSDWLSDVDGPFDMIVSNPPYIAASEMADLSPEVHDWEPHLALTPGGDGLAAYRKIARDAPRHLTPGGFLMVEIGPTQADSVMALFRDAGLVHLRVLDDLDGRNRVISGEKPREADG